MSAQKKKPQTDEEDEKAIQDLLNKMKEGTSAPQHVDRQIRELDKLVKRIRHKRYLAQKALDQDQARVDALNEHIGRIHRTSYDPLKAAAQAKRARLEAMKTQLRTMHQQMTDMANNTRAVIQKSRRNTGSLLRKEARNALDAEHGGTTCFRLEVSDGSKLHLQQQLDAEKRARRNKGR